MEELDCVVVGAGWSGIGAARQMLLTQPNWKIAVLDEQSSLGGIWAEQRLYPGLKSNNLLGTFEYPDFPMVTEKFGIKPGEHITGQAINAYINAYVDNFGIRGILRHNVKVLVAEHQDAEHGGWLLTVRSSNHGETKIFAHRLIIATGILSEPLIPSFKGQDAFGGTMFHSKDFSRQRKTLQSSKSVTVYGAGKSAWDAVYEYATAGIKVNWVIRSSGHGPIWMSPPHVTPFKQWIEELANRRCLTWFSPCVWGDADGYPGVRSFFHSTSVGRFLADQFWGTISQDVMRLNQYDSHPDTAKLKPWLDVMFVAGSYSFLNYNQNFFDLVKSDLVNVFVSEISHLSAGKIHLVDGTDLEADTFVVNTGSKRIASMKFLPEGIEKELGIPHLREPLGGASPDDLANQQAMFKRADDEILQRFPRLRAQPVFNRNFVRATDREEPRPLTPWMLYRFLVPPSPRLLRCRDIAFCGMQNNLSTVTTAYISALWISAYFSGELGRDPGKVVDDREAMNKLQYETVLHNRFGKWRHPTDWGDRSPNFMFDALPYLDMLMQDLGLNPFRKMGRLAEMYSPYKPGDYCNITKEWLERRESKRTAGKSILDV